MYSLGIYDIDNVLMIMGACNDLKTLERNKVAKAMMEGFCGIYIFVLTFCSTLL
jgi:hypothetical protein